MAFAFNPFTGNFDLKGSGGGGGGASYIDGEVQNFSALPTANPPAVDSAYLVREAEGTWLISRKPAGIYIRVATTGTRATDWTYAGILPDVFSDANFLLYDNGDSSKNLAFQLSGLTTGTTRTLTVPDASGTIALTSQLATGSTDNAVLRADGTGGSTAQAADIVIDDATTSTQANVAIVNAHSETNSSVVLTPKGTGAFIVGPKPDGTSTGGNARGTSAVDLQAVRAANSQVSSGNNSTIAGGTNNTASSQFSTVCGGRGNVASGGGTGFSIVGGGDGNAASGGYSTVLGGLNNNATGNTSCTVGGFQNRASAEGCIALGGRNALADRWGMSARAAGQFAAQGDAQYGHFVLRCKTTTDSAVEMFLDGSSARLTCPSGKVMAMLVNVTGVKSDGSAVAHYVRQYAIKNVGGTTTEVYAPVTIGTDTAASTSILLEPNDTNDALKISCTGIASEVWRWVASVDAVEVAYGS